MDSAEYYDLIGATGERDRRDPHDFDKKCEDCGHMVTSHGADGCEAPVATTSSLQPYETCGCTSYEWADDDE